MFLCGKQKTAYEIRISDWSADVFSSDLIWSLSAEEQAMLLGLSDIGALQRWRRGGVSRLSRDTLERISYVFGIFKSINMLLPRPERADAWLRAPNSAPLFRGRSALERMTAGNVGDQIGRSSWREGVCQYV